MAEKKALTSQYRDKNSSDLDYLFRPIPEPKTATVARSTPTPAPKPERNAAVEAEKARSKAYEKYSPEVMENYKKRYGILKGTALEQSEEDKLHTLDTLQARYNEENFGIEDPYRKKMEEKIKARGEITYRERSPDEQAKLKFSSDDDQSEEARRRRRDVLSRSLSRLGAAK